MPKAKRRSSAKVKKTGNRPCTYELGYVRQDLYACRKCTKAADGVYSGFCRGCRETCHADCQDEVFELYTKRHFRCDCGNTRARNTCLLFPNKDDINVGNERSYSHNFESRYCRCDREYNSSLPMAQCAMCEDWFHEDCYRTDIKERGGREFDMEYELVCRNCVQTLPLLADYYETLNAWAGKVSRPPRDSRVCTRPRINDMKHTPGSLDFLWRPGFRRYLCQCAVCMEKYREAKVLWIVDEADFVNPVPIDDSEVLGPSDDAEIVRDALDEEIKAVSRREAREREQFAKDRIPRKPAQRPVTATDPVLEISSRLGKDSVEEIRSRINQFLRDSIQSNGGTLNNEAVLAYMSDLKADMVASFNAKLNQAAECD